MQGEGTGAATAAADCLDAAEALIAAGPLGGSTCKVVVGGCTCVVEGCCMLERA